MSPPGAAATRAKLTTKLKEITTPSTIKAVDLIFVTHGLDGAVKFSDGTTNITNVKNDLIAGIPAAQRNKLRAVFSTACFGSTHNSSWIAAGFNVSSGAKKI